MWTSLTRGDPSACGTHSHPSSLVLAPRPALQHKTVNDPTLPRCRLLQNLAALCQPALAQAALAMIQMPAMDSRPLTSPSHCHQTTVEPAHGQPVEQNRTGNSAPSLYWLSRHRPSLLNVSSQDSLRTQEKSANGTPQLRSCSHLQCPHVVRDPTTFRPSNETSRVADPSAAPAARRSSLAELCS